MSAKKTPEDADLWYRGARQAFRELRATHSNKNEQILEAQELLENYAMHNVQADDDPWGAGYVAALKRISERKLKPGDTAFRGS